MRLGWTALLMRNSSGRPQALVTRYPPTKPPDSCSTDRNPTGPRVLETGSAAMLFLSSKLTQLRHLCWARNAEAGMANEYLRLRAKGTLFGARLPRKKDGIDTT